MHLLCLAFHIRKTISVFSLFSSATWKFEFEKVKNSENCESASFPFLQNDCIPFESSFPPSFSRDGTKPICTTCQPLLFYNGVQTSKSRHYFQGMTVEKTVFRSHSALLIVAVALLSSTNHMLTLTFLLNLCRCTQSACVYVQCSCSECFSKSMRISLTTATSPNVIVSFTD